MKRRESSGSGMGEDTGDLLRHLSVGPIGVALPNPGSLEFARGPIEAFGQGEPPLGRHPPVRIHLLRTHLFIDQHGGSMHRRPTLRKQRNPCADLRPDRAPNTARPWPTEWLTNGGDGVVIG